MSVNNFSFKYICVVLYLELRFYCLTCLFTDFRDFNSENRNVGVFQNKTNIEITGFSVTHFGYTLDLSDTDLWNIDLLDTYLDLLDTDITSKHFVCLQDVLKTFTRYVFKTSWRPTNVCWAEPFFLATCVSFYNAAGNLDVYLMFQRFSSLDSSKI